ncbi:autophagy-related protein 11-like [Durio zibethinus]|uniref:Autophagy-related protein 11-like n=1 Tax=Durio zibethinus TaxID=66656 RepID=A0A6P5ZAS7_DURZI|nr:autophagy-related protein 11-like [Durio zibethinus]
MSSSITENLIAEGKLLVHVAENGYSYELDCDETTLVKAVMQSIEPVSGIPFNDQLVLCADLKLEPQRPLSTYKLPSSDSEVFIFNKARLQTNSRPPLREQIDIVEVSEPRPLASSSDPHPLDDSPDPALKALPSYERQFRYHYHRGRAIYNRTLAKFDYCERLLRGQKVQERALGVASSSLNRYYGMINQNCSEFMKQYKQKHRYHTDLLANFDKDMQKLRSIKLHPTLQTVNRKYLLDFVKEDNLRKSAENYYSFRRKFDNKVAHFNEMFGEVKRKVEELFTSRASLPIKNLELTIKEHQRYLNEQKSIMQSLSKDVNTVKKLVDDCLSCQLSSSLRPHDAVSALGPMYDVHNKSHLPKMLACERAISKLLESCKDKKNEMNIFFHSYMQKTTYITSHIKNVKLQFPVFEEAMMRLEDLFIDLKLVRGIGPAYRACLAEIVRRKASMILYMGMAGQLAERLATKREVEVRRREKFLKEHGLYIPKDVLASMGLYDTPNQFDVNIAPFDTTLLDIDIPDLDYYAPECLVGLPTKVEKPATLRGSISMSNESSHLADTKEIGVDTLEKDDSDDFLEGCELVEIAGTSKMEVENAKLKAELASAVALICSLGPKFEYGTLDDSKVNTLLKNTAEKTAEDLHLKDEFGKHLQSMLKEKQIQCVSYEKRIQELEQRLSDQHSQGQKLKTNDIADFGLLASKADDCKPELSGYEVNVPRISTSEPMDEVSCLSNSLDANLGLFTRQLSKGQEEVDQNMMDSSGMLNLQFDSSMQEPHREELQVGEKDGKDKMVGQSGLSLSNSSTAESMPEPLNALPLPCETAAELVLDSKVREDLMLELQSAITEKLNQLIETKTKLRDALDEVSMLRREMETSRKLLDESQMNCAHLENCLHEAREEAQIHCCAADRRASEYSAQRASAVKMRGLFEILQNCVYAPGGMASFADSLRALAQSSATSVSDGEDDGIAEFHKCIRVLAEKVGFLSGHLEELHEKNSSFEAVNEQLRKELEEKNDLVKTLYTKHQLEMQANKEKISFSRLQVHEIAAFVLNSAGHYEAITRNCFNYYLSAESVALFTDHLPSQPCYIVGQIVHIEHKTVKPLLDSSTRPEHGRADPIYQLTSDKGTEQLTLNSGSSLNPYGLPIGCEYFIVTIAMLHDPAIHSPPPS